MSLYERLGGQPALEAAVFLFYDKIKKDARVKHFFEGVAIKTQQKKMINFMSQAFGGPYDHTSYDLRKAHAHLNLSQEHFNAVADILISTLKELNVPDALQAEIISIVATTQDDVLGR